MRNGWHWGLLAALMVASACDYESDDYDPKYPPPQPGSDGGYTTDGGTDGGTDPYAIGEPAPPIPPVVEPYQPKWPWLQKTVEHFEISFGPETAAIVYDMSRGKEYAPGTFKARGRTYQVMLRQRGDGARYHPKLSWKVKLPDGETIDGIRRLNFLAEYLDGGYLTDMFSYRLMAAAGVPAPRPRFVTLTINGKYEGIYVLLEEIDKHFLRAHHFDEDGNVYRAGHRDGEIKITPRAHYQSDWDKETNELEPRDDLAEFLDLVNKTPEHQFEAMLERNLDVTAYVRYMAVNALIGNHGIDDSGSFFAHDLVTDKWSMVPWDLNNAHLLFWRNEPVDATPRYRRPIPIYTIYDEGTLNLYEWKQKTFGDAHRPFSVLSHRIWDRPALRERVLDELERLIATVFSPAQADPQIDAMHAVIQELLKTDPWVDQPHAARAPGYLKDYIRMRADYLTRIAIPKERSRTEGDLVIGAYGGPGSRLDDHGEAAGFIELRNLGTTHLALGGKVLTDDLRDEFKHRLPDGLSIPAGGSLVLWADGQVDQGSLHLPFTVPTSGGELGVFDGVSKVGLFDLVYVAPLPDGAEYARIGGTADWRVVTP